MLRWRFLAVNRDSWSILPFVLENSSILVTINLALEGPQANLSRFIIFQRNIRKRKELAKRFLFN